MSAEGGQGQSGPQTGASPGAQRRRTGPRSLWEVSNDLFCVVGPPDWRLKALNPAWPRILGWRLDQLIGMEVDTLLHPGDEQESLRARERARTHGYVTGHENRLRAVDDEYRWFSWSGYFDGTEYCWVGVDVTARKDGDAIVAEREARATALLGSMRDGYAVIGPDGKLLEVNGRLIEMTGVSADEVIGTGPPFPMWREEDYERLGDVFAAAMRGEATRGEYVFRRDGGDDFPAVLDVTPLPDSRGFFCVVRDVTTEAAERADLQRSREQLQRAQVAAQLASWEWDPVADRVVVWQGLSDAEGRPLEHAATLDGAMEVAGDAARPLIDGLRAVAEGRRRDFRLEWCRTMPDGEPRWMDTRAWPVRGPDGAVAVVRGITQDVTEQAKAEQQIRAARDYLSAIANSMGEGLFTLDPEGRTSFINPAAEAMLGWSSKDLAGRVMHDVTHHRRPDGSPRPIGDSPMTRARRLGEVVRVDDDVFVREDGSDLPVAYTASPFETEDGIRGTVVVFTDITEQKKREHALRDEVARLAWVGRIRDALREDRFVLYAQPIVDIRTGTVQTHELLIRMVAPDGSLVAPGEFLPAAETYGLIGEIDRWVVARSAELAAAGHRVEINISAASVGDRSLLPDQRTALARSGADPSLIAVEITETALLSRESAAREFLEELRLLGCAVALDDFGVGYGAFTHLKELPIDFLKIDMEFVRDLTRTPASRHVVQAIVSLADGFGLRTIAEGVENEETLAMLSELGVELAQGFLIGRPAPVLDVLR
jgi:PAS domain S-box-containing protein